ncbi:fumarylacetoacetate hydrolase family protein [Mycolicibacterium sp. XJ1819]
MKLATYSCATPHGRVSRVGVLRDGGLVDVTAVTTELLRRRKRVERASQIAEAVAPSNMNDFIAAGAMALELVAEALQALAAGEIETVGARGERVMWPIEDVSLEAPLLPTSMREYGVFNAHLERLGIDIPPVWFRFPLCFKGNPRSVIGPEQQIAWPAYTEALDFELEIGAIIGRTVRNATTDNAMDAVYGYTIFNDVSARDIQRAEQTYQVGPSKGKDFCNVLGPVLVTRDELGDGVLEVAVRVNGQEWVRTDTSGMHYSWADLVAHASWEEELVPGDLITAGTVSGCCALEYFLEKGLPTAGPLLSPGDVIELDVSGIGVLRNTVGPKPERMVLDYG